ncbi:hypothetical protein CO709_19905 [Burkholderia thailandensis]|nr:hypothetical protein CO709_19905 [Burkholderia thailandensis]
MVSRSLEWSFVGKPRAARRRRAVRLLRTDNVGARAAAICVPGDISSLSRYAPEAVEAVEADEWRKADGPHARASRRKYFRMRNESADVCRFSITRRLMTH